MTEKTATEQITTGIVDVQLDRTDATVARFTNNDGDPIVFILPLTGWATLGRPLKLRLTTEVRCQVCGCTDSEACLGGCSWSEPGLCSGCAA